MPRFLRSAPFLLLAACAGRPAEPRFRPELRLDWEKNILSVAGEFPGGKIETLYLEAYCRSGSTRRKWGDTVIPHRTELVERSEDGHRIRLRDTVQGGVVADHVIRAEPGVVVFETVAVNRGPEYVDAVWVQPCIRVGAWTGLGKTDYVKRSFIFVDGKQVFLDRTRHEETALYVPGQVYVPPGVGKGDVNPRPYSPDVPSNGLIGCVSADGRWIFATAWEPYQELFQGVITCIHSDYRLGGLAPGDTRRAVGRMYFQENDPDLLVARWKRDFMK
jgi:hypothetical protein